MAVNTWPPYTPMPSLGHELGLMFGFLALCGVVMGVYVVVWRAFENRLQVQEFARKALLVRNTNATADPLLGTTTAVTGGQAGVTARSKGAFTIGDDGVHEKMLDRYAMPEGRAELPVHGMDIGVGGGNGVGVGSSTGRGVGVSERIAMGIGSGTKLYANEKWESRLTRVGSPLSPVSPLSPLGAGTGGRGIGSADDSGFASVGIALTSSEVGRRHSLGKDVREGRSPVEIGPGVEVEEVKNEEQKEREKKQSRSLICL
ncbi:uncharacterized protein N7511_002392 [Penicillium nucicola]|uniref:uncharacterized protein n=1 Tax=Penicillium nucicola TaxID=1850975 RepID=UPI0025453792|nr:uncharacterized protein N7511_002392 [Penicillium nucicola]KAJ5770341.1 hypothetical protein N7511_002392 [Penicillium nucicola]